MVEPFYDKVIDFGMEFTSDGHGRAVYCGLSLFNTVNGAYAGSVLATEKDKLDMLAYYVDRVLLMKVRDCIAMVMGASLDGVYQGPFGVDMMVVASHDSAGFLLHPCVELNLRRTMGHVAMEVSPTPMESRGVMRICYDGRYRLRICNTGENVLNTGLVG